VVLGLLLHAGAGEAQTITLPTGNQGAYSNQQTGPTGAPGNGDASNPQPGSKATDGIPGFTVDIDTGTFLSSGGSAPTLDLGVTGGTGGWGNETNGTYASGGTPGGAGGQGGTPGELTLTMQEGSSIISTTSAPYAVGVQSRGGVGGFGGVYIDTDGIVGKAGDGGDGSKVSVTLAGSIVSKQGWNGSTPGTTALLVSSTGGDGADCSMDPTNGNICTAHATALSVTGQPGGAGGAGGEVDLNTQTASFVSGGTAVSLLSQGGAGTQGSQAYASGGSATGGDGGAGGNGGVVSGHMAGSADPHSWVISAVGSPTAGQGQVIDLPNHNSAETSFESAAVEAQSFGGDGGLGGDATLGTPAKGGAGGAAGSGGNVTLEVGEFVVSTTGHSAPALLAQSIGGSGGTGASAGSVFSAKAGRGASGGDGGTVNAQVYSEPGATAQSNLMEITTTGGDSGGIVAQSIGGGGGAGGDVSTGSALAGFAVGGNGEKGGNGAVVTAYNGDYIDTAISAGTLPGAVIKTSGDRSSGIMALSVGGGGGSGGNASSAVTGPFSMTIGGNGGSGGTAGVSTASAIQVGAYNNGIIQTSGAHAMGMQALAVGGGGGAGGSASSLEIGAQVDVTLAVGGVGGSGGTAGHVVANNDGQILTQGNNAYGMQVLSVGGGGGNGGASKAAAYQLINTADAPSLDFNLTVGGNGGSGGDSGEAEGTNNFSIVTNGAGSHGMLVQSIGGGGGDGGDSSSTQLNTVGSTVNINLAIGGSGGAGGSASTANATNNGIIWTMNRDSDGIVVQSIGGGGGNGGVGNADTSQFQNNGGKSGQFNLAIGGSGGSGNVGSFAQAYNNPGSTILTMGDDSRGIFVQSIGGGGGKGNGAISNGSTGDIQSKIAIGGNGGTGNDAEAVQVTNNGSIVTGGGDAAGIYAQSIGGGGGAGGNAGTSGGKSPETQLFDYLAKSNPGLLSNYNGDTTGFGSAAAALLSKGAGTLANMVKGYYADNAGSDLPSSGSGGGNFNLTLNIGGGFAGAGGSGGSGLMASVTNTGSIQTLGPMSDGIYAESVGGGGGDGGTITASDKASASPSKVTANIALGGRSGSSGNGAFVDVTNSGSVATAGSASLGVLAASIGGGGGTGGFTTTSAGSQNVSVQLGGDGGSNGVGSTVKVTNTAPTANGVTPSITTTGSYAAGIGAVSLGGGGGVLTLNQTTTDATTGGAVSDAGLQMSSFRMAGLDATSVCDTTAATCGNGGEVDVTAQVLQTAGTNAHGVVAQSVGGGGGWVIGAATGGAGYFNNVNGLSGNGGTVTVNDANNISTAGNGAYGILAQSVGGGGLLAGDLSASTTVMSAFTPQTDGIGSLGNGGAVNVYVDKGATLSTSGDKAVGVFAQSVGGGGGLVASDGYLYAGTAGGSGTSGPILVQVDGAISTTGKDASAVAVDADGGRASSNAVNINVTGSASTEDGATIYVHSNAASNTVTNSGTINHGASGLGFAVYSDRNPLAVNNQAGGTINGAIQLANGTLTNGGTWAPEMGTLSYAGNVNSSGTIVLGGDLVANAAQNPPNTMLSAPTVTTSGTIRSNVDFVNQQNSTLDVIGAANVSGTVLINPLTMAPGSAQILYASKGLNIVGYLGVADVPNYLYTYTYSTALNTLLVTPQLNAVPAAQAAGLGQNAQQLAGHLQANFAAGNSALWPLYTVLANVHNAQEYHDVLQGLGAESLQMVGVARTNASELFVNRMNSCPDSSEASMDQHQRDCVWGRVADQATTASGSDGDSYHLNEHVVQFGGQREVGDDWWVGGSVAYNKGSESAASGVGGVTDHGFNVGAVVKREWGPWLFSGAVDIGQGSYQSNRNLTLTGGREQASGSFDANNVGLHSRIAYLFSGNNWYVKPYVDVHAVRVHTDSFEESNLGAIGFKVGAGNGTVLSATPMVEVGSRITFDNGAELRPSVAVGEAVYSGNHWDTQLQMIGNGSGVAPFTSRFDAPNHLEQYNAGLDLKLNSHSELRLDYTGQFGNGYRTGEGALRYSYFF